MDQRHVVKAVIAARVRQSLLRIRRLRPQALGRQSEEIRLVMRSKAHQGVPSSDAGAMGKKVPPALRPKVAAPSEVFSSPMATRSSVRLRVTRAHNSPRTFT